MNTVIKFAWSYFFVLIWLAYLICAGVLLFSRGFLLSRVSKTDVSFCRRLSTDPNDNYHITTELVQEIFKDVNASSNLCLPQKSKVIILVIDALKYEFGVFDEKLIKPLAYQNKLTVMHELLRSSPANARIFRFKADPPTTTLQRLKGLTTGSLPTFIDIGSNFASPEINEDNIIDQIVKSHLPVVFMGDSTWTDLYPRRFKRAFSYPSFDIFDLDTVDKEIQKHLPGELKRTDWDVLIAHFLGVDHCGHKYGPLHQEMTRKLNEMNDVIRFVVENMDEQTTLLVMGDHGMTITGDHGGDTEDETNALLFAYSKQNKFVSAQYGSDNETLHQIDLVPTLATILGVPIPYSNLGLINFNIVPDVAVPHLSKYQTLLLHAWHNAQQIYNYFYSYAVENKHTFSVQQLNEIEMEYILLSHRVKTIYNEAAFKSFFHDLNLHLRQILTACRDIWVKFDSTQISQGLLITCFTICLVFLLINNSSVLDFYRIFTPREVAYTYLLNFAAGVFGYRYYKNFNLKTEENGVIFFTCMISTVVLVYHIVRNWPTIAVNWHAASTKSVASIPTRLILLFSMGVYFSNSFIIEEPKVLSYLLVGVFILIVYELVQKSARVDIKAKPKSTPLLRSVPLRLMMACVVAIVLIRVAYMLFRCREEQGNCTDFVTSTARFSWNKVTNYTVYGLSVFSVVLYTTVARMYLQSCGNLTGYSPNVILARYGPTIAAICVGGHILLENSSIKNIKRAHIDALALIIYAFLLLQIIIFTVAPLMVFEVPPRSTSISVNPQRDIIPELFKKMKSMYEGVESQGPSDIPVVYGLATVYSSIIISFGVFLALVLIILLEPTAALGMVICIVLAAILLTVHAILRYKTSANFDTCIQPNFKAIVGWFLLAHFCFFATSHQTTLSQIDWRAAFVGRTTGVGLSNFVSGILVILNTFCGQILFFSMYGLLCTETFSIFALFPKLIKSYYQRENRKPTMPDARTHGATANSAQRTFTEMSIETVGFDMTRGELVLYENDAVFLATAFKLGAQFFMLQGVKVFCAMFACTIHCRHLMVWKIFAPRFIYEGLATFVSLPAIIIGFWLIVRVHCALEGMITRLNKVK